MIWRSFSRFGLGFTLLLAGWLLSAPSAAARSPGEVDNDGIFTVMDLARQLAAANGRVALSEAERAYADANRGGVLTDEGRKLILIPGLRITAHAVEQERWR